MLLGKAVPCLVDSGSETTLVPKTLIESYRNVTVRPATTQVWAANNTPIQIDGEVDLPLMLEEDCLWTRALVSRDVEEVTLGSDWLKTHNCIWDFGRKNLLIRGQPAVILSSRKCIKCRRVIVQKNQQIPPRTEVNVKARVTVSSMRAPAEEALVDLVELKPGLYVDRTLLPAENRNLRVCVVNTTTEAQKIAAGTCLGNASSVSAVINGSENSDLATASDNKFLADIIEEAVKRLPDTVVDARQKREVEELLQERRNLFSRGTYDMGSTNLVQHSIDTRQYDDDRQLVTSVSEDGN